MKKFGKTIKIHLPDISVPGLRFCEILGWTGQAIIFPRSQFQNQNIGVEKERPGIYFLFGTDENTLRPACYVGEGENVWERIKRHLEEKSFWNEAVFFTNKDDNLTKSHIKYWEFRLLQIAKVANRYTLDNGNTPNQPTLPRPDQDNMEEFIEHVRLMLGVFGHKVLEPLTLELKPATVTGSMNIVESEKQLTPGLSGNQQFTFRRARAAYTDDGIVVLAGSVAAKENQSSLPQGCVQLKSNLIERGVLIEKDDNYIFQQDYLFPSPSQAACIIAGCSINGRNEWKNSAGKSLKEIEEAQIR